MDRNTHGMKRKTPRAVKESVALVKEPALPKLHPKHLTFAEAYLENGFNGTAAYRTAYPNVTRESAATSAWRLLRNVEVLAYLRPRLEEHWKAQQMGGDEALGRIALAAALDVRRLFNERGELLLPHEWPDEIAGCVRQAQQGPYGLKLTLVDPLLAQRTILEQTGKLRAPGGLDALADLMRRDIERNRALSE